MKRVLVILLFSILAPNWSQAQVILKNEDQVTRFKAIPQERIFAHINTSLFLTGEYLYYTIYCISSDSNQPSDLSKIGYVELISEKGEQLFKQKIKLDYGLGHGDFFIPVTAITGSYKLLAYTNWMKNGGVHDFFQADIHIINPYQASKVTNKTIDIANISTHQRKETANIKSKTGPIELDINGQTFNTRSKVSLTLKSKNETTHLSGNYSISVRKKDKLPQPSKQTFANFITNFNQKTVNKIESNNKKVYLPELRGELLSGKVTSSINSALEDLKIAVSIPGENFYIALSKTDSAGNFYINVDKAYEGDRIFLEIIDQPQQDYVITLNEQTSLDYTNLMFENLVLDSLMMDEIIQRSIHNQIDNAYYKYKPDSIVSRVSEQLFDGKTIQLYKLDDYTRFRSVRETVFEIVKDVTISRIDKLSSVLKVQGYNYGTNSGVLPLVLIDGLQITNYNTLLDKNAYTIDEIKVYRDRFVLGPKVYQGAILFKTKNNTSDEFQNATSIFSFYLLKPQVNKNYFKQRYDLNSTSRIPDDRLQLLWIPNLKQSEIKTTLDFFTSDVTGDFEICIEGFTSELEPVSIKQYFSVKNN